MIDLSVPLAETTPKAAIIQSQTPLDMVNVVLDDPAVEAVFNKYLGNSMHSPIATIAATGITVIATHFGLQLSDQTTAIVSGVVGLLAGYGWNLFSTKVLTPKTPVTK